eukprot:1588452-Rhodomonas_salina.1
MCPRPCISNSTSTWQKGGSRYDTALLIQWSSGVASRKSTRMVRMRGLGSELCRVGVSRVRALLAAAADAPPDLGVD